MPRSFLYTNPTVEGKAALALSWCGCGSQCAPSEPCGEQRLTVTLRTWKRPYCRMAWDHSCDMVGRTSPSCQGLAPFTSRSNIVLVNKTRSTLLPPVRVCWEKTVTRGAFSTSKGGNSCRLEVGQPCVPQLTFGSGENGLFILSNSAADWFFATFSNASKPRGSPHRTANTVRTRMRWTAT